MFLSTIVISYNRKELTKYFIDSQNKCANLYKNFRNLEKHE